MPRQRLFWKLFLSFWAALLFFALGVLYAASAYLDATRSQYDNPNQKQKELTDVVFATAQAAANNGLPGLVRWAKEVDDTQLVPLLILDSKGRDLLGRDVSDRALARLEYLTKNYATGKLDRRFPVELPDGREYWPVPDFQSATLGRLISRPRVVATQLVLATLIGAVVCVLLAGYLTAPLEKLRAATIAYGSGDFSHRVAPTLGRRRDEIVDLAHAVDTMAERIDALIGAQRGLLRDVSHELRSPLARVQVAVGLARQRIGNAADVELGRIDCEMERLNELIGRIIDFSRLDTGLNPPQHEVVRLDQLLGDAVSDAQLEAESRGVRIELRAVDASLTGDARLLASAIENVLRNAVRHSPDGGAIRAYLTPDGAGGWRIVIADQGAGIPPELQERVFEPFFRVDAHRDPQGGIGLGLAIARRALTMHGGNIVLHNLETGGLEVSLYLPAHGILETNPI